MPKPYVVGIDPSISSTAVAYGRVGCLPEEVVLKCFTADAPRMDIQHRIARWHNHAGFILKYIDKIPVFPHYILIEGYSYASKGRGVLDIAEFGGVFRYRLINRYPNIELVEIPPANLKQFVTGKGNASKMDIVTTLTKKYGVQYKTNDEYDAFGLHLMAQCYADPARATNAHQKAALAKLK